MTNQKPRMLIIDDLFGREHPDGKYNANRADLCANFGLEDATKPEAKGIVKPVETVARAVFLKGQQPEIASVGDVVENDLEGTIESVRKGWENVGQRGFVPWSMVLLDLHFSTGRVTEESHRKLPGMPEGRESDSRSFFGLEILERLRSQFPHLPVVVLSAQSRADVEKEISYQGALGFIPRTAAGGCAILADILYRHGLYPDESGTIVGNSLKLLLALRDARRAARDRKNVLLRGERGSGKELFARYIHEQGDRKAKPFVCVNTSHLNKATSASLLFGHARGAFTDAVCDHKGHFREAHEGDLFLDEIGDLAKEVQPELLRVLEDRKVQPLGSASSCDVDVRFVSATNEDIEGKSDMGGFRSELLDRLRDGRTIWVPPLRERGEDIPLLVERFMADAARNTPVPNRKVDELQLRRLAECPWPGNVRELKQAVARAVQGSDVEFLVFREIPDSASVFVSSGDSGRCEIPASAPTGTSGVDRLREALEGCDFSGQGMMRLKGMLPKVESWYARFVARYLELALENTRHETPKKKAGIRLVSAIRWIQGGNPTTVQAADVVKRLLRISPEVEREIRARPESLLAEAYEYACRRRCSKTKKSEEEDV